MNGVLAKVVRFGMSGLVENPPLAIMMFFSSLATSFAIREVSHSTSVCDGVGCGAGYHRTYTPLAPGAHNQSKPIPTVAKALVRT